MKKNKLIFLMIILIACLISCKKGNLVLKSKKVDLEYGNMVSKNIEDYVNIEQSSDEVLKESKLDLSLIKNVKNENYPKLGLHTIKIMYDGKSYEVEINVKDTQSPIFTSSKNTFKFIKNKKPKKEEILKFFKAKDVDLIDISIDDKYVNYDKEGEYEATIIASDSSDNKIIKIFIVKPTIQFINNQINLELWSQKKLALKTNEKKQKISYQSSNNQIVSVSTKGVITAKRKGTAYITATVNNEKTKCKVIVNKPNITNAKQAKRYLLNYLKVKDKNIPSINEFDHTSDHGYVIHGYDMGNDFTFTSYWYAISQNGNIYDEILCQYDYINN